MKRLLVLSVLVLLTGCVTYYQPETALEDGVYYAEDDPSYVYNSGDYSGVIYYPWSSFDYLYFGYSTYYGYGFIYGYPYAWPYSPWGYRYVYYDHFSPWPYPSYRHHNWRPYRGRCSQYRHYKDCRDHDDGHDRYAGDNRGDQRTVGDGIEDYTQIGDGNAGEKSPVPVRRYLLTPPGAYTGSQGVIVRNGQITKIGRSSHEPATPVRSKSAVARSSASAGSRRSPSSSARSYTGSSNRSSRVSSPTRALRSKSGKSSRKRDRD